MCCLQRLVVWAVEENFFSGALICEAKVWNIRNYTHLAIPIPAWEKLHIGMEKLHSCFFISFFQEITRTPQLPCSSVARVGLRDGISALHCWCSKLISRLLGCSLPRFFVPFQTIQEEQTKNKKILRDKVGESILYQTVWVNFASAGVGCIIAKTPSPGRVVAVVVRTNGFNSFYKLVTKFSTALLLWRRAIN